MRVGVEVLVLAARHAINLNEQEPSGRELPFPRTSLAIVEVPIDIRQWMHRHHHLLLLLLRC